MWPSGLVPGPLALAFILVYIVTTVSTYRYNGSCSTTIECLPRETFMRCTRGRCLCAADSDYDIRNGLCRLKINVQCYLYERKAQPCVKGASCDPPSYADGSKILKASTGNCKCYQGESIEEDGTCSAAVSLQRSFGYSSVIFGPDSFSTILLMMMSIAATILNRRWYA